MTTPTSVDTDELLSALDQLTNTVYWLNQRHPITATQAIVEALDDWIAEHAAEHHQSQSFLDGASTSDDPVGIALTHLLAAVAALSRTDRPLLDVGRAFTEAIGDWVAATTAEHHFSDAAHPWRTPADMAVQRCAGDAHLIRARS